MRMGCDGFDRAGTLSYHAGKMKTVTRLTSKGQVIIPKPVRERLSWRAGTALEVQVMPDGTARLTAQGDDPIERALGFLDEGDPLAALEAEHRAEVEADERRRRGC